MQSQISQIGKYLATNHSWALPLGIACVVTSFMSTARGQVPSFMGVGHLPGGNPVDSVAYRVSDDGSAVIGSSFSNEGQVGFVWTPSTGIQFIPFPPGSGNSAQDVRGLTADGSTIVGGAWGTEPFYWTEATGSIVLPGTEPATASAIAANGSLIAGYTGNINSLQLATWTAGTFNNTGVALANPDNGQLRFMGVANSGIVASTTVASGIDQAFEWSAASGTQLLPNPISGAESGATEISGDGNVVVGWIDSASGIRQAAYWTSASGWAQITNPFGANYESVAMDVSADGSTIVGYADSADGQNAFIWTPTGGTQLLQNVLADDLGLNLQGWTLSSAYGISSDGLHIAGGGIDPAGDPEGFVATVPEPSTIACIAVLVAGLTVRRRTPIAVSHA
jgi:uncharacterized membrane protein